MRFRFETFSSNLSSPVSSIFSILRFSNFSILWFSHHAVQGKLLYKLLRVYNVIYFVFVIFCKPRLGAYFFNHYHSYNIIIFLITFTVISLLFYWIHGLKDRIFGLGLLRVPLHYHTAQLSSWRNCANPKQGR